MTITRKLLGRLRVSVTPEQWRHEKGMVLRHVGSALRAESRIAVARVARAALPQALLDWRKDRQAAGRVEPAVWPLPERAAQSGLARYEYSRFSQNGEDGILRYLFNEIGTDTRCFLEFGFSAFENNCLRLALSDGWRGVFLDGNAVEVRTFTAFARRRHLPVQALATWLTRENIADVVAQAGVPVHLDLLSIDIDGNDFWMWEALSHLRPRVVLVEYNASFGPDASVTVPYDPAFERYAKHPSGFYHTASLVAFTRLADRLGYALVGCDSRGINAFFVRRDCLTPSLVEVAPSIAFRPHAGRLRVGFSTDVQMQMIASEPVIAVPPCLSGPAE